MKTNNFKPTCQYYFSDNDYKFIIQLAKVGSVHLLSRQVRLISHDKDTLTFLCHVKDNDDDRNCLGMVLPDGWIIENIYVNAEGHSVVTFGVNRDE